MEDKARTSISKLNKNIIIEILKMLECKEIYMPGSDASNLIRLNRKIYYELGFH